MLQRGVWGQIMLALMVVLTLWNCVDGGQSVPVMLFASLAVVATVMALRQIAGALPNSRLTHAILSAVWIMAFLPGWDWLAGRYVHPDSLRMASWFGSSYGVIRYFFMRGESARPPF